VVEMALPDNFQGSEPLLLSFKIPPNQLTATGSTSAVFFQTGGNRLYRIRFVNIIGSVTTSGGTATLTFEALIGGTAPPEWPRVGPLVATAPHAFASNDNFSITWSTDIADNYEGFNDDWGVTLVMGLPLLYIPDGTELQLNATPAAGQTVDADIQGGLIQYESFPPGALQGGGQGQGGNVYLLPATI
jgi:hypothetical protein